MKYRTAFLLLALGAVSGTALLNGCGKPSAAPPPPVAALPSGTVNPTYRGVAGCSGRACHGGTDLANGPTVRNAATHWLEHDKHADAYRVLFDARARQMAERLAGNEKLTPAHKDARCLACHTIPQTVYPEGHWPELADDWHTTDLRRDGVGCEACHGPARDWLEPHTTFAWAAGRQANYAAQRMTWLNDYQTRAKVCTGCHVGAAEDKANNLPLRDVNHDLIAAGHPRLNFELASYQETLPPHWVEKDLSTPTPQDRPRADELQLWLAGQVRTAEASLDLLQNRAELGPWPEFAESDCYACHHDLAAQSWRQDTTDFFKGREVGVPPWNRWQVSRPFAAVLSRSGGGDVVRVLEEVRTAMSKPHPNRANVRAKAKAGADHLRANFATLAPFGSGTVVSGKLYDASDLTGEAGPTGLGGLNWDDAVQYYLLLAALRQSRPAGDVSLSVDAKLSALGNGLSFPRDKQFYDSPRNFGREEVSGKELRRELDEVRRLLKP